MSSTLFAFASDTVVLGLAASTIGISMKSFTPFRTSLGTEDDDDSLLAPELDESSPRQPADINSMKTTLVALEAKGTINVTVSEVPLTPPIVEIRGDSIFPASLAA